MIHALASNKVLTVLTRHYAPFNYKPSLTICINLLRRYILSPIYAPLGYTEELNDSNNESKVRTHCTTLYRV